MGSLIVILLSAGLASAQVTPEQRQAILNYQLSLPKASQIVAATVAIGKLSETEYKGKLRNSVKGNPSSGLAALENDPKIVAIFKENGMTVREYLTGSAALNMAMVAAQGVNSPDIVASPANIAFAKANLPQLQQMMATSRRPAK